MTTNDRAIVGLTTMGHAMVHTYELSIPILMTIWLGAFELSKATLGLVVAVGYGLYGLGALPGGILTDRFGAKRLILAGIGGMGAAFVLLSVAQSAWMLTAALLLWGAAASVYHPAGLSLISTGVVQRGRVFGLHGMAGNLGIALGPLVTTVLLLWLDWRMVSALLALPAAGALVLAMRLSVDEAAALTEGERQAATARSTVHWRDLWADTKRLFTVGFVVVFGIVMLSGLYYRGVLTFLPDLLGGFPALQGFSLGGLDLEAGRYVYAGLLLVGVGGQYVGGLLTDRVPTERGIAGAFVVLALIALAYLPAAQAGLGPLLAVSAMLGFFLFVVQPLYQATVAEHSPADARGLSYGFTYLGVFGIGALGAALTGVILQYFSPGILFGVLAGFAGVALLLAVYLMRRRRHPA